MTTKKDRKFREQFDSETRAIYSEIENALEGDDWSMGRLSCYPYMSTKYNLYDWVEEVLEKETAEQVIKVIKPYHLDDKAWELLDHIFT